MWPLFAALLLILQIFTIGNAQDVDATIKVVIGSRVRAEVSGTFAEHANRKNKRNIFFLDDFAGMSRVAERISGIELFDAAGQSVAYKKFNAAEIVSEAEISGFKYSVDLTPLVPRSASAHLSWANESGALLMPGDLLPQSHRTARIKVEVPAGWQIATVESAVASNVFEIGDIDAAVLYAGIDNRERELRLGKSRLRLNISGEWQFTDEEAAAAITSIFAEYEKLFGAARATDFLIRVQKFPIPVNLGIWEADTRGRSVTIISSDTHFKSQSIQKLHEQLRHELFHFWIPNGVNLSGNYDWFYEGFALYASLKTAVATGQIRFADYLDTLSRAYQIDAAQTRRMSLIDASKDRFNGSNTQVYARGMIVAFLSDIALLERSKGKRSMENLLREIYQKHHKSPNRIDGNVAVIAAMKSNGELQPIVDRYIAGSEKIEWSGQIQSIGLVWTDENRKSSLAVRPKLNSRQKDLLDKLGYNAWRKTAQRSK